MQLLMKMLSDFDMKKRERYSSAVYFYKYSGLVVGFQMSIFGHSLKFIENSHF